tara:strand:+ start:2086 stop:3399 length:1314 start_codon:yes stop_codon:yes gene_type:complete
MYVDYETISTHLNIKKGIDFLNKLKNNENKFSKNFWNSDIYNKKIYNNYIRTVPYFWLNNDKYDINNVYQLNELDEIPWYYDFRLYEDVLESLKKIDKKDLWNNFDYSEINRSDEKHYIANKEILKSYIPRGYIIPPFDKNILNINKKNKEIDNKTELYDKKNVINDKYTEIDNEIKEYINNNVDDFTIITNIGKLKKIADKNFNLLDTDGDNIINFNELQKIYLNLQNNDKDIIESFVNIIDSTNNDDIINNKLINDNIHLDNTNSINKKNYINSITLSYIKSEDFDKTLNYNKTINSLLIKNLNDKIKIMEEESSEKIDTNIGNIDNNNSDNINSDDNKSDYNNSDNINSDDNKSDNKSENNNSEDNNSDIKTNSNIHENTWKESLIKIGLWTIGIITIICILIFILFAFVFNNKGDHEVVNNDITPSNIESNLD